MEKTKTALDYFWEQINNKLDCYQKELFTQYYDKAKLIEKENDIKIDINQKKYNKNDI